MFWLTLLLIFCSSISFWTVSGLLIKRERSIFLPFLLRLPRFFFLLYPIFPTSQVSKVWIFSPKSISVLYLFLIKASYLRNIYLSTIKPHILTIHYQNFYILQILYYKSISQFTFVGINILIAFGLIHWSTMEIRESILWIQVVQISSVIWRHDTRMWKRMFS